MRKLVIALLSFVSLGASAGVYVGGGAIKLEGETAPIVKIGYEMKNGFLELTHARKDIDVYGYDVTLSQTSLAAAVKYDGEYVDPFAKVMLGRGAVSSEILSASESFYGYSVGIRFEPSESINIDLEVGRAKINHEFFDWGTVTGLTVSYQF